MNILERLNRQKTKRYFYIDYGRGSGGRAATGIFVYTKPANQVQRNHNKEALTSLETKKSQMIINQQAIEALTSRSISSRRIFGNILKIMLS